MMRILPYKPMRQEVHSPLNSISANIQGAVSGQLAVGNNIVQIGNVSGGLVYVARDGDKPAIKPRPSPVLMRPRPLRGLVDRETERSEARKAIIAGESIELHAEDGFGKTTLLRSLAHEISDEIFPNGILFITANGLPGADVLQQIFSSFYQSSIPIKLLAGELHTHLHRKKAWIILDNFVGERADLEQIFNTLPSSTFLITSCVRRLWDDTQSMALGGLPEDDAIHLFERELGRSAQADEREALKRLCRTLDRQPLVILQTASVVRSGTESIAALLDQASSSDAILEHTLAKQSPKRRSIVAALAALGSRLSAKQLEEITGLGAEMGSELEALAEVHLLNVEHGMYGLAPNAADKIATTQDLTEWKSKGIRYLADWAQQQKGNADELLQHREPLVSAMREAIRSGLGEEALQLSCALDGTLAMGGLWESWHEVSMLSLEAARITGSRSAEAWALHQLGTRSLCLGELPEAKQYLYEALEIRTKISDKAGMAATRHNLGLVVAGTTEPDEKSDPTAADGGLGSFTKVGLLVMTAIIAAVLVYINIPPPSPKPPRAPTQVVVAPALIMTVPVVQGGEPASIILQMIPVPEGPMSLTLELEEPATGIKISPISAKLGPSQPEATFTIETESVEANEAHTLIARAKRSGGETVAEASALLSIRSITDPLPPRLKRLMVDHKNIGVNTRTRGVVSLDKPATKDITVSLKAAGGLVRLPQVVRIMPGKAESAPFNIIGLKPGNEMITAHFDVSMVEAQLVINRPPPQLKTVKVDPKSIDVNSRTQGVISLDKPSIKDITVSLKTANGLVRLPQSVEITQGKSESDPFNIIGLNPGNETITAVFGGLEAEAQLVIYFLPPQLQTLELSAKSIYVNRRTQGVVSLDRPAIKDITVSLKAANSQVRLPQSVEITQGKAVSAPFNIIGLKPGHEKITALFEGSKAEAQLVINRPPDPVEISQVAFRSNPFVRPRQRIHPLLWGTVTLATPAARDVVVELSTRDIKFVNLQMEPLTILKGRQSAPFKVYPKAAGRAVITARIRGERRTVEGTLTITQSKPSLIPTIRVTPATVVAGQAAEVEIISNQLAPKAGWAVRLTADTRGMFTPFPLNLRIKEGTRSIKFKIYTLSKARIETGGNSVKLTATIEQAESRPATLQIRPQPIIK
jgi:hypothetical protein